MEPDGVIFEEEGSLRIRRDRVDSIKKAPDFLYADPEWIAEELAFFSPKKKDKFCHLIHIIKKGFYKDQIKVRRISKIQNSTEELGQMIAADRRLGDLLDMDFLMLLLQLLKDEKYPYLQSNAATILRPIVICPGNDDVAVVIKLVTPIVVNLISSKVDIVRVEALWLLHNLVYAISKFSAEEALVEEALPLVTTLTMKDSIGYGVLYVACETLSVVCEVFPNFSPEKLKFVLPALLKLIQSDVLTLLTSGCWGLALLCDGRGEMVVEERDLDCLIGRLVNLMRITQRVMVVSALHAMGSIVRWGNDEVIEAIIKKDGALHILSILLDEEDMYIVKQTCWILSNITARKEKHIRAVIDGELISPLVNIVQNCELGDVREQALWALSNAMCGVDLDQIECLRNSCSKVCWADVLFFYRFFNPFVLGTIEGLVNINLAKVTWDERPIDGVELQSIFKKLVHDSEWISNCQDFASGDYRRLLFIFPCWPQIGVSFM